MCLGLFSRVKNALVVEEGARGTSSSHGNPHDQSAAHEDSVSPRSSPRSSPQSSASKRRRPSDPLAGLSELSVPSPISHPRDMGFYRRHTLEENVRRSSRGEDPDVTDDEGDGEILVRHHTLEENIELARQLSVEMRRQSEQLRRLSMDWQEGQRKAAA